MKINTAVRDYIKMFPSDYELVLRDIEHQRHNLKDDYASIKGHVIKRAIYTIPERLSTMFAMKLDEEELVEFSRNPRWFAENYPQFAITKQI